MKKFVKNLVLFTAVVSILVFLLNSAYEVSGIGDYYNIDKFDTMPKSIQICNFGSSHGLYGFNYEEWEEEYGCFNFALSSQSVSYDYRLFQFYKGHISENAIVFITVSYFSLFGYGETYNSTFYSMNKRYYGILPSNLIKEYDFKTDLIASYLPVIDGENINRWVKQCFGIKFDNDEYWQGNAKNIDVAADAERAYTNHLITNKLDGDGKRIINQEEVDALYGLIEGCKEVGATPILVTTPYLMEYTDMIKENSPDFYRDFYSLVNQVANDMDVKYYDYAFDERFCNDYGLFINSDHLNKQGAKLFTRILMEDMVDKNEKSNASIRHTS